MFLGRWIQLFTLGRPSGNHNDELLYYLLMNNVYIIYLSNMKYRSLRYSNRDNIFMIFLII